MYFAYTICSTIGFGNFAPQTQWGRALVALLVPPMVVGLGALIAGLGTAVSCKLKRVVYILTKDHCNEQQQAISVAMIAFFLNLCNFVVTKRTSAVTLQVLGNVKVVIAIGISLAIFGNSVSTWSAAGCIITLAGVAAYNKAPPK